jgi:hypothetical protein
VAQHPKILELLEPSGYEFYRKEPKPATGWPERDTPKALLKSLDKAHDNLSHALRENDRLRLALIELHRRQRWQLRVFIALTAATWSALGWVFNLLIPYAIHGMAK